MKSCWLKRIERAASGRAAADIWLIQKDIVRMSTQEDLKEYEEARRKQRERKPLLFCKWMVEYPKTLFGKFPDSWFGMSLVFCMTQVEWCLAAQVWLWYIMPCIFFFFSACAHIFHKLMCQHTKFQSLNYAKEGYQAVAYRVWGWGAGEWGSVSLRINLHSNQMHC